MPGRRKLVSRKQMNLKIVRDRREKKPLTAREAANLLIQTGGLNEPIRKRLKQIKAKKK